MNQIPIRLRVTAASALAMALVLATAGFSVYDRFASSLDHTLTQGLRARIADVSALVRQADTGLRDSQTNTVINAGGFAQVLDARGRIFDQTPGLGRTPLLTQSQLVAARHTALLTDQTRLGTARVRLLATPVTAQDQQLIVVVGTPLKPRDDALSTLRTELLVGGPLALLVASLVGYLVAAAALRPVEAMRKRAAAISANRLSERLPVVPARDELSRLSVTLNDMLDRLESAMKRERSFIADASHELRTPLTHLQAEVELALDSPRSKRDLEAALHSIRDDTDHLSHLAQDLLLLARADDGALPIRTDPTNLDDLLRGVAARFDDRAHTLERIILTDGAGLTIPIDRLQIGQALGNLTENALRHGAGTVRMFAAARDGHVDLHVTDEGSGFPDAFLPRAFERFSRADDRRGVGGSGLGLAIVKAVAAAHNGVAAAANTPAGGADVWLTLPSRPPPSPQTAAASRARPSTPASSEPLSSSASFSTAKC